jgi:nucleotide-binding universal stress UspA family protein
MTGASMILVPLDGSSIAEHALGLATMLARRSGARLHIAKALEPLPVLATGEEPVAGPELDQELRELSRSYLASTAEALGTTHGLEVGYSILEGPPATALARFAADQNASLIVMSTHGQSGFSRFWLGSVADRLLRRTSVPLLLLKSNEPVSSPEFRHVLVALDGQPECDNILEPAIALGSSSETCRYTLVHVVEPPIPVITRLALQPAKLPPEWQQIRENRARSHLNALAEQMRTRGLSAATRVILSRAVAEEILALADSSGADLIVVGTHGARGLERLLLGSVADKVVRGATHQVLVVPTLREQARQ